MWRRLRRRRLERCMSRFVLIESGEVAKWQSGKVRAAVAAGWLAGALAAAALGQERRDDGTAGVIAIRAGTLHIGDGRVVRDAVIILDGGKIIAVGGAVPAGA